MGSRNSPKKHAAPLADVSLTYTRIAVALGERDPDSIDYYYGTAEWVTDIRENPPSLAQIRRSALALIAELRGRLSAGEVDALPRKGATFLTARSNQMGDRIGDHPSVCSL